LPWAGRPIGEEQSGRRQKYRRRLKSSYRSSIHPMTFFEFLSAAAWAGIVSSDFRPFALHRLGRSASAIAALLRHNELGTLALPLQLLRLLLLFHWLEEKQKANRIFLDARHETFEQVVGLFLVLDQWIALAIATE